MSIIETLTEGMVNRNLKQEGTALLNKWTNTGLLEGLSDDNQKASMARLLENQARELLRESNSMGGANIEGFAAVAFPIVRRVFAGLIANDLVSVQPMSLPSGLIFFLDFKFGEGLAGTDASSRTRLGESSDNSIYGQGAIASQVTGGVLLNNTTLDAQPYGLGGAYSSPTGSHTIGQFLSHSDFAGSNTAVLGTGGGAASNLSHENFEFNTEIKYDPDLLAESTTAAPKFILGVKIDLSDLEDANNGRKINLKALSSIIVPATTAVTDSSAATVTLTQVRRLTSIDRNNVLTFIYLLSNEAASANLTTANVEIGTVVYPMVDTMEEKSGGLGAVSFGDEWGLEGSDKIPEIDIKVDSIAITAVTKKLKAKWTPELGQDLNAYHNLDAEVELTSILSEQIALEIDREILSDLVHGATAGTYYWSRSPGLFVNRETGAEVGSITKAPDFTGTVSEWYETLIETINDVSAQIHRKTLRGGANFCVVSPEIANILEFTAGFRANVTADADKGDIGAVKVGSLNRKFDVIVDPYFPRNAVLVGRKGSSFLESGYVYAPYVPLQTTPTIFGPEDFVPRKGVMTRYGKKMVRPDMYGLVIVRGLLGESGLAS